MAWHAWLRSTPFARRRPTARPGHRCDPWRRRTVPPVRHRILWFPTVGFDRLVTEYIDAAAATHLSQVSLNPLDLVTSDDRALLAHAEHGRDQGVTISVLDGVYSWLPLDGTPLARRAATIADTLRIAESVGATSVNALAVKTDLPLEAMIQRFAALCDQAADAGCRVHVEFAPMGGVPDLATAWEIVRLADRVNGGILFDTWHFFRGAPDIALLDSLPGDRIFAVQISDADSQVKGSLIADTMHHRRLPGKGSFDLTAVIQALDRIGGLTMYGPEVISDDMHALPANDAARRAMASVDGLLKRALAG